MRYRAFTAVLLLALAVGVSAAEIRVATLNCFLLFDPMIEHRGTVDNAEQMTLEQYAAKLSNLASLVRGYQVVGLQETGGRAEIAALASKAGMSWAWTPGLDTATGEEVGLLYNLPGWQVSAAHRVPQLDRVLSKHLEVVAAAGQRRLHLLVVHLLRPMNNNVQKHRRQLEAVGQWMKTVQAAEPNAVVVVMGDTNSTLVQPGGSVFGPGIEANEQVRFSPTHLTKKPFDRLVVLGPAEWGNVQVVPPPYGSRPSAPVKRIWTDHYLIGATLRLR